MERGSVTKSQKGKKAYVDKKVGQCFQWKAKGQNLERRLMWFSHDPASAAASGNECEAHRAKGRSSSPAPRSKAKTDGRGETPSKSSGNRGESPSDERGTVPCRKRKLISRHVMIGIHPCVKITSLRQDAYTAINVCFDMSRPRKSPARSQRKMVRKDQLP